MRTTLAANRILCLAVASCLSSSISFAQMSSAANMQIMQNGQNARDQQAGGSADKSFLKKTLQDGLFEIAASRLALQKTRDASLNKLAQQMVDDHIKLGEDMTTVARQVGVGTVKEPAKKDKAELAKLQGLSGAEFDHAYIELMLKGHEAAAAAFRQEAFAGNIPLVKAAAAKNHPIIESHLQMVQGVAKEMHLSDAGV